MKMYLRAIYMHTILLWHWDVYFQFASRVCSSSYVVMKGNCSGSRTNFKCYIKVHKFYKYAHQILLRCDIRSQFGGIVHSTLPSVSLILLSLIEWCYGQTPQSLLKILLVKILQNGKSIAFSHLLYSTPISFTAYHNLPLGLQHPYLFQQEPPPHLACSNSYLSNSSRSVGEE